MGEFQYSLELPPDTILFLFFIIFICIFIFFTVFLNPTPLLIFSRLVADSLDNCSVLTNTDITIHARSVAYVHEEIDMSIKSNAARSSRYCLILSSQLTNRTFILSRMGTLLENLIWSSNHIMRLLLVNSLHVTELETSIG